MKTTAVIAMVCVTFAIMYGYLSIVEKVMTKRNVYSRVYLTFGMMILGGASIAALVAATAKLMQ